jgi:hypothetical protein
MKFWWGRVGDQIWLSLNYMVGSQKALHYDNHDYLINDTVDWREFAGMKYHTLKYVLLLLLT